MGRFDDDAGMHVGDAALHHSEEFSQIEDREDRATPMHDSWNTRWSAGDRCELLECLHFQDVINRDAITLAHLMKCQEDQRDFQRCRLPRLTAEDSCAIDQLRIQRGGVAARRLRRGQRFAEAIPDWRLFKEGHC